MATRRPARSGWLQAFPQPRLGRGHRSRGHHYIHHPVEGIVVAIGRGMLLMLIFELWALELTIWALIWGGIYATQIARWAYRTNLVGNIVATVQRRPRTRVDPHPRPVDLAALGGDPWGTGTMRRRP